MKKVLVFRHVPHEGLGTIEPFLKRHLEVEIEYCDLFSENFASKSPRDYDYVIAMGGPMNVDETERYPFLLKEREFISSAIHLGIPVLGICLGAQMIARALGAKVYPGKKKEIGWYPIQFSKEGSNDPLFRNTLESNPIVFHWHGDTFDLPKGATLLASSELFPHQAFRFGENVYAFQFHLEMTSEIIRDWVSKGTEEIKSLRQPNLEKIIDEETNRYGTLLTILAEHIYEPLFSSLAESEKKVRA